MKSKKNIIYEETGKIIYQCEEDDCYLLDYTDEVDINSKEKIKIKGIGAKYLSINSFLLEYLNAFNISTAYKKVLDGSIQLNRHTRFPFYINILNYVDKRTAKIFSIQENAAFQVPLITFHYGSSNDNLITENHLISLDLCPIEDIKVMKRTCTKINAVLKSFFERRNATVSEFNCFFGKEGEKVFITDDFTPVSLKIFQDNSNGASINPYKIKSAEDIKGYSEFIHSLITS